MTRIYMCSDDLVDGETGFSENFSSLALKNTLDSGGSDLAAENAKAGEITLAMQHLTQLQSLTEEAGM